MARLPRVTQLQPLAAFLFIAALTLLYVLVIATEKAHAANPQRINFQGKVTNADGTNVANGTYTFRFRLYNHATNDAANSCSANSCIWEESKSLTVTSGVFQTELGDVTALPDFNANPTLYLGIVFNNDAAGEMSPRVHMTSVPYALNSDALGGLTAGNFVQLAQGLQTDSSTSQASIAINKTNVSGTPDIVQLQKDGSAVFSVSNSGAVLAKNFTNSTTAFQVQNVIGSVALGVDTTPINSLVTNSSFEDTAIPGQWVALGTASISRSNSVAYSGNASLQVSAGTDMFNGVKFTTGALTPSSTYTISYSMKQTSGPTLDGSNFQFGLEEEPLQTVVGLAEGYPTSNGWIRYKYTFTAPSTGSLFWQLMDDVGSAVTFNIDAVQIEPGSTASGYKETGISLNGRVNSPTIFQNVTDSTVALQVRHSNGSELFTVDTLNSQIQVEGNVAIGTGKVFKVGSVSGSTVSVCGAGEYVASFGSTGGLVTSGTCTALPPAGATSLDDAYNQSGTAGNTITLTSNGGGLIIQDADTPLGTTLFAVQEHANDGGSALFSVTTSGWLAKNTSGDDALTLDTSTATPVLKVHGDNPAEYAHIYYDSSTDTAYFSASNGTSVLGTGTGSVTISAGAGFSFAMVGDANSSITTTTGDLTIDATAASASLLFGTGAANKTIQIGTTSAASTQTIGIGNNATVGSTANITIGSSAGGTTTVQGATAVNIGSTAGASTTTIDSGTGGLNIGDNTVTKTIDIGGVTVSAADTINIATNGTAADTITIGNTNTATKVILQGGPSTTTSGTAGIIVGSATADSTQINLQLDSYDSYTETASTCSTTVNQGALYYNTVSNGVRVCTNGSWEDLVSTAGLGLYLFGVVPDSPNAGTMGDMAGSSGHQNSPCKVYWASDTSVTVAPCVAYSSGRKVIVSSTTLSIAGFAASNYANVCLTGTNNQPAFQTANAADNAAAVPTWNAASPVLCLATVRSSSTAGVFNGTTDGVIYDIRTYTTTTKSYASINAASALGVVVVQSSTASTTNNVAMPSAANVGLIRGVLVARNSTNSSTAPNAIIATAGPQWVKATGTSSLNSFVKVQGTSGYTQTGAIAALGYDHLGVSTRTISTSCTSNTIGLTDCQQSQFLNPMTLR